MVALYGRELLGDWGQAAGLRIAGSPAALKEINRLLIRLKETVNTDALPENFSKRRVAVATRIYQKHIAVH